jgi:hypothetical protein
MLAMAVAGKVLVTDIAGMARSHSVLLQLVRGGGQEQLGASITL